MFSGHIETKAHSFSSFPPRIGAPRPGELTPPLFPGFSCNCRLDLEERLKDALAFLLFSALTPHDRTAEPLLLPRTVSKKPASLVSLSIFETKFTPSSGPGIMKRKAHAFSVFSPRVGAPRMGEPCPPFFLGFPCPCRTVLEGRLKVADDALAFLLFSARPTRRFRFQPLITKRLSPCYPPQETVSKRDRIYFPENFPEDFPNRGPLFLRPGIWRSRASAFSSSYSCPCRKESEK